MTQVSVLPDNEEEKRDGLALHEKTVISPDDIPYDICLSMVRGNFVLYVGAAVHPLPVNYDAHEALSAYNATCCAFSTLRSIPLS